MKNKELFDRANMDNDFELKAKLRNDFENWCKVNGRTPLNPLTIQDWWQDDVNWGENR